MQTANSDAPRRLLVIDDNEAIHRDIQKILRPQPADADLAQVEEQLFGRRPPVDAVAFRIDSAFQGQEGLALLEKAMAEGQPYAVVFVDVRMPPGWDGIETLRRLWACQPDLQAVICTAYSDHSWDDIVRTLGHPDQFVILKKPFDNIELLQLAHALSSKWMLTRQARLRLAELDAMVELQTSRLVTANEQLRAEIQRRGQVEMELRASEHRFQLAFKASSIPMAIMHAPSQTYLEVNDSFTRLVLRPREAILDHSPKELGLLVREQDCDQALEFLQREGRVRDFPCRIQPGRGEPRETLVSLEPVVLGEERCLLVAMMDVTEQRKLEAQLRQSQKMDAIGQLAAGVAHDFNNLLTIIHGHASLQMARPNQDAALTHSLTQVKLAADRAATLTRQLLAFSRKQVMQFRPICLNDSIERSQGMFKRLLGETIRLECACTPDLPRVLADDHSLDQVIMNLVVNARDAMPGGGVVRISTAVVDIAPGDPPPGSEARPGRYVRLSVEDTGCGMDTTVLSRIFEPFFTTKAPGKGTGLGLSTAYGIVQQHGGWMDVRSAPGQGTHFHVFLAVTDQPAEIMDDAGLPAPATGGAPARETVLVVEDEPVLREFVTAVLQQQGYRVLDAGDGLEALRVSAETPAKIDLLLTDMVMPNGLTGIQLASQMWSRRPELKVLFISGYSQELMDQSSGLVIGMNFLPKPFDVTKLLKAVRRCLDGETSGTFKPAGVAGGAV